MVGLRTEKTHVEREPSPVEGWSSDRSAGTAPSSQDGVTVHPSRRGSISSSATSLHETLGKSFNDPKPQGPPL
jgi:hypothetical protein